MKSKKTITTYTADQVWGAACAANRINYGYHKDAVYETVDSNQPPVLVKEANKHLMRHLLEADANGSAITEDDIKQGKACRAYYQTFMLKELAGTLNNGFLKAVYALSVKDEFRSNEYIELAQIAAAPQGWLRDVKRQADLERANEGTYIGSIGEKVNGTVEVSSCNYSANYGIYFVHGFVGNNAVFFSYKKSLNAGDKVQFKGTVKAHRDNNTTQLNRVKIIE